MAELGLGDPTQVREVAPLTDGVASDIARVDLGTRHICVKFALPKLKVAADWRAPVHRNAAEYAWLSAAARVCPDSAVQLYGRSPSAHGFAMEYLEGPGVYLWKEALLARAPDRGEAPKVAALFGRIHAASAHSGFDRSAFHNRDDFHALRIDPYLCHTRKAHPALAPHIAPLEAMLYESAQVLVHGDASPKNILMRGDAVIALDAECATMGDASFDPAFCLNHLALKAVHMPDRHGPLMGQIAAFWRAYAAHIEWEPPAAREARICALLPVLMLARVDGKSPVEYLSDAGRQTVRDIAIPMIKQPPQDLGSLAARLTGHLSERPA